MIRSLSSRSLTSSEKSVDKKQELLFTCRLYLSTRLSDLLDNGQLIQELKRDLEISEIYIDNHLEDSYSQQNKKVLIIKDSNNKLVGKCVGLILVRLEEKELKVKILVLESFVSVIIGKQGRQINYIKQETKADIVIKQPDNLKYYREIEIFGKVSSIVKGIREINEIMSIKEKEDKANYIKKEMMERRLSHNNQNYGYSNYNANKYLDNETKVRIPLSDQINELINKKMVIKQADKHGVHMIQFYNSYRKVKCLGKNENVVELRGRMRDVKEGVEYLIRKLCEDRNCRQEIQNKRMKLLIPNSYVTKLIGSKGSMIRELAQQSGGASIKIQSNKDQEKM